jgi:hypothetical protein
MLFNRSEKHRFGGRKMQQKIAKTTQSQHGTRVCVLSHYRWGQGQLGYGNQAVWARPP